MERERGGGAERERERDSTPANWFIHKLGTSTYYCSRGAAIDIRPLY